MRVLVAEDDPSLRSVLERGLSEEGYTVDAVDRGDDALDLLLREEYAVAVLDWQLPGLSGIDVLTAARRRSIAVPALILTARDTPDDRIHGLDSGADDYLVKPFHFGELLARLRALQRRPAGPAASQLTVGSLTLDPATHEVRVHGRALPLTPREYSVLEVLMRRWPQTVARATIEHHAWPEAGTEIASNTLDVHVARLRNKLRRAGVEVEAARGVGFRIRQRSRPRS